MNNLTHVDQEGSIHMVDVGHKPIQSRYAYARGKIFVSPHTIDQIQKKLLKKGDVLLVAQIAGIQAAKKTADLITLCHPLLLDKADVKCYLETETIVVESEIFSQGRTGIEMEALLAVSVALLNIYDMCKAIDKTMRIGDITLIEKRKT